MKIKVSVILPVFNGERYLKESVKSVLNQSFKNFELLIIDDGSKDQTIKILKSFKDQRIKIIRNKKNLGVARSLNIGLKHAKGCYIARMDADDISRKDRFKKQVGFLDKHPDYVLVGSRLTLIDEKGHHINEKRIRVSYTKLPLESKVIKKEMYKRNPISHPSVMLRREVLEKVGGYSEELNGAEDYDLWFRLAQIGKVKNLPESLIKRRYGEEAVSIKNHFQIELLALMVRFKNLPIVKNLGLDFFGGFFLFYIYRFWMNFVLFNGRDVPPEPDDSYFYLASANHLWPVNSFEAFRLFIFSVWLNTVKLLSQLDWERTYYLSFYIGIFLMFLTLIFFLRKYENNLWMRLVLISLAGFFTGSGVYHGFYWVVPSFYQLMIFLILLVFVLSTQKVNLIILAFFASLFIFIHPSSPIYFSCFLLAPVINSLLTKKKQTYQIKKGIQVCIFGVLSFLVYSFISYKFPQTQSPESPFSAMESFKQILSGNLNFISWGVIWHEYFRIILLNPVTGLITMFCLGSTYYLRKFEILSVYLTLLVVVLISSFVPYGYRTLEFLWLFTFFIFGYGLIGLFYVFKHNFKIALLFSFFGYISFAAVATGLNIAWISSVNVANDYDWSRGCVNELIQASSSKPVYFYSKVGYYAFQTYNLPSNMIILPDQNTRLREGDVILINTGPLRKNVNLNPFSNFLVNLITRDNNDLNFSSPSLQNYWQFPILKGSGLVFKKILDCNFFQAEVVQ